MEKRATVIEQVRQQYKHVLLLDAGDLFKRLPQRWRHEFVSRAYRLMNYDGIALGEKDFVEGPEFLMTQLFSLGNIINTNIQYLDLTFGSPYKIFVFDSVKIGVTAMFDSSLAGLVWVKSKGKFTFTNPLKSLKPVVNELQKKCDFIILLAHSDLNKTQIFVRAFPQIGLVVNGHSQQLLEEPIKEGSTFLVQTDGNAYRLGKAILHFKGKQLTSLHNEMILLDDQIPNHPGVMDLIELYKKGPNRGKAKVKIKD